MELRGKRVLLTGASGGIGEAIARRLAREGAQLVISGRRREALEALAEEIEARVIVADLAVREDTQRLAAEAGAVDILVANAALPASGRLPTYTVEQIDRAIEVNLRAPIVLTHALTPGMGERGGGHVVLISSLAGKTPSVFASLYSATKYGLRGFALAVRFELRSLNVGVSTICPGFISDAGMFANAAVELPRGAGTRTPEDVASAVCRAVRRNVPEIDVAPPALRVGAMIAGLAPRLAERFTRAAGGERIAASFEDAQIGMR